MKIDGKNYQVQKSASEIALSELNADKNEKMKKFFSIFDKEGGIADGKLSQAEISEALKILQQWEEGKKSDGELTDKEIKKAMKQYPELKGLSKEEAREFIKTFLSLNEQKVLAQEAKEAQEAEDARKAEEARKAQEAEDARLAEEARKAEEERRAAEDAKPKTFDYVVPEGQSFKALMKKVLVAQGKKEDELTDEDYAKAEEQFRADNPDVQIRGNKTKYLLAGEKVKVSVDFGEELLDSNAEESKWSQKVEARRQAREKALAEAENRPDPKVVEEAKAKGYRPTENKHFFYDEATKTHYRYKDGKFVKYDNIKLFRKDGTYVREYKNADASAKVYNYSKDGYPTTAQGRNYQGKVYLNEKKQAQVLGFRDTFATNNKHIYYDPKTKMHFQWNDEKKRFDAMDKDVRYVSPDGYASATPQQVITTRDKKTGEVQTRTEKYDTDNYEGFSYTYDKYGRMIKKERRDGNTFEYTVDNNGNRISTVHKRNGVIQGIYNHSYDNTGFRTHTTHRDATGRVVSFGEFKDVEGTNVNEIYKDGTGKLLKSLEWRLDENGTWTTICKDGTGKEITLEEYEKIEV